MITSGQVTANGTTSSLCILPPGPCLLSVSSDPASAATAYIGILGPSGTLSSTNGFPVASGGQFSVAGYPGSRGGTISVVTAGTATATLGWMISRG